MGIENQGQTESSDVVVEDTSTNGADGTVPVSQGDGTLSMGTVGGNTPDWQEDANSPWNLGNDGRVIPLDGEYDVVRLIFTVQSDVSRTNAQEIKPNPNQSGHSNTVYFKDGSTGTGTPLLAENTYATNGFVDIDGRWVSDGFDPGDCGIFFGMRTKGNSATHAFVENIESPLEEIAIFMDGGAQDADIDIQILGRDVP